MAPVSQKMRDAVAGDLVGDNLGLDDLCWIYDNNYITIDGNTRITLTEDVAVRFLAYGWNVLRVGDANDLEQRSRHFGTPRGGRPTAISVMARRIKSIQRKTEIAIRFHQAPNSLFRGTDVGRLHPNWMILRIQPDEGIALEFAAKRRGQTVTLGNVKFDFAYNDYFKAAPNTGYETLIYDCLILLEHPTWPGRSATAMERTSTPLRPMCGATPHGRASPHPTAARSGASCGRRWTRLQTARAACKVAWAGPSARPIAGLCG